MGIIAEFPRIYSARVVSLTTRLGEPCLRGLIRPHGVHSGTLTFTSFQPSSSFVVFPSTLRVGIVLRPVCLTAPRTVGPSLIHALCWLKLCGEWQARGRPIRCLIRETLTGMSLSPHTGNKREWPSMPPGCCAERTEVLSRGL